MAGTQSAARGEWGRQRSSGLARRCARQGQRICGWAHSHRVIPPLPDAAISAPASIQTAGECAFLSTGTSCHPSNQRSISILGRTGRAPARRRTIADGTERTALSPRSCHSVPMTRAASIGIAASHPFGRGPSSIVSIETDGGMPTSIKTISRRSEPPTLPKAQ